MSGPTEPLGMRRQCPSGAAIYGISVNQSARRKEAGRRECSDSLRGSGDQDRWSRAAQPTAKPPKALTHLPANAPQARAGDVRLQRTCLRERDRRSPVGQSAAEGRGAKRWPEGDRRFLSLPHAKRSRHSRLWRRIPVVHTHFDIRLTA